MSAAITQRGLYKKKGNTLQIDQRIKTYDYEFQMDYITSYVFDRDLHCIFCSYTSKKKTPTLKDVFPADLVDFMEMLVRNSFVKAQMIHVKLNENHVLFSTNQLIDHTNRIMGIIVYEIPFSNVQTISVLSNTDFKNNQTKIVLDKDGVIFAIEKYNWDKFVLQTCKKIPESFKSMWINRFKADNILHKPYVDLMDSEDERGIMLELIQCLMYREMFPIRFCKFVTIHAHELKIMVTLSRFVNGNTHILMTQDVLEDNEMEKKHPDLFQSIFPELVSNAVISQSARMAMCVYCNRIKQKVDASYMETLKKNVAYYHSNIPPIYDDELEVPNFGRRGKSGQQSYKMLTQQNETYNVWMNYEEYSHYNMDKRFFMPESNLFKFVVCDLCKDEWNNFFETLNSKSEL